MMNVPAALSSLFVSLFLLVALTANAGDEIAGFPEPQEKFQTHIQEVKQYLLRTQMNHRLPNDVEYNIPFERKASTDVDYRGRFLLIHGLSDSPYVFTDVATELVQRGFDVRAILLPGHGNTPEAQLKMSSKRWMDSARQQLLLWKKEEAVPTYIAGFSMGGVIATMLALEHNDTAGLLLFSPAFRSSKTHLLRWSALYSKFKPWVFGGMIIEDNPTKYNSIPINGVAQYYNLTKLLRRQSGVRKLDMPVLAVASSDDSVIDIDYMVRLFNNYFSSNKKKLIIYTNNQDRADTQSIDYRTSAYPELRILSQSHQGVIMSRANPLFGQHGSVLVCNGNDWPTFSGCLYTKENRWYGAQHAPSPDGVPVARTTYNPDFDGVFAEFDKVFEK